MRAHPAWTTVTGELLARKDVEAVVISCAWESHIPVAVEAMQAGIAVGMEVGGAYSIRQCWDLVEAMSGPERPLCSWRTAVTAEEELMALNMVRQGAFGEVVHCRGGYMHDLREEVGNRSGKASLPPAQL